MFTRTKGEFDVCRSSAVSLLGVTFHLVLSPTLGQTEGCFDSYVIHPCCAHVPKSTRLVEGQDVCNDSVKVCLSIDGCLVFPLLQGVMRLFI